MKVILVMVASANGKITRGTDPDIYKWTSKEDAGFFYALLKKHKLSVMGRSTYEAAKKSIKPDLHRRRIILTSNPNKYKNETIPGQIEFSSEDPKSLVGRLEKEGYENLLLVGGGETNKKFFAENLVDELYLTIEPKLFGKGKTLVGEGDFTSNMELISSKQLNNMGTLLLHYKVTK